MAELRLRHEHLGTCSDSPGNDRLLDDALLRCVNVTVFLDTTDFTEEDEHLAFGIVLVAQEMVDEGSCPGSGHH